MRKPNLKTLPTEIFLKWDTKRAQYDEIPVTPPIVERDDGVVLISAEDETSYLFADYYGEHRGGYPWINPKLEEWAHAQGFMLEWENPGALGIYEE